VDAPPPGARPFAPQQYIAKFKKLADGVVDEAEQERFLTAVQDLENLTDLTELNVRVSDEHLATAPEKPEGIF